MKQTIEQSGNWLFDTYCEKCNSRNITLTVENNSVIAECMECKHTFYVYE